jgi:DNA-binding response OmpR family regulator
MASVLIVEDDGLVARQMARALRDAGHTSTLASDGRSALREIAAHPDVVLLDLGLPDVPGEAIVKHLKSQLDTAQIPVLVITGEKETATRLRESGTECVADVLLKPVSSVQLRRAVDAVLASQQKLGAEAPRMVHERQDLANQHPPEGPATHATNSGEHGTGTLPHGDA